MAVNKVVLGENTLIDLTGDTVSADKLAKGTTAHDMAGEPIVGTMEAGGGKEYTFTNGLTETNGTVSWDLNNNVSVSPYGNVFIGSNKPASLQSQSIAIGVSPVTGNQQTIVISSSNANARYYKDIAIGYNVSTTDGTDTERNNRQGQIVIGNKSTFDGNQFFILADGDNHPDNPNVVTVNWDGYLKCTGFTDGSTSKTMGQILAGGGGGGGSSYKFTNGLTNSNDVISWDLYNKIQYIKNSMGNGFHIGEGNTLNISNVEQVVAFGGNHIAGDGTVNKHYRILLAGENNTVGGSCSSVFGGNLKLNGGYATAIGTFNVEDAYTSTWSKGDYVFIVGNGISDTSRSNAYTLDWQGNGTFAGTVSSSTGADYAEYFEWKDGNPNNEDRVGYIVTLDGDKIVKANTGDDVLGICSGTAMVLGDSAEWNWSKRYLTDDFGRIIYEDCDVEHEEIISEETGEVIEEAWTEHIRAPKQNPEYDASQPYVKRADRPEWQIVGMMGKLYVRDDGSCVVNGYADVKDGIATKANGKTNMRVMERVTDNIVRVLMK